MDVIIFIQFGNRKKKQVRVGAIRPPKAWIGLNIVKPCLLPVSMTSDFSVTALHDFSIVTDSGRCEPYFLGSMSYTQQRLKPE